MIKRFDMKKDKKDVGRPTVMTKDVVNKLEQAWSMGCSDLEACIFADISKQTLYSYQDKHPEFIDRKELLKKKPVLMAKKNIIDAMDTKENPDYKSIIETSKWYLERKCKDEFSTKVENDIKTTGINITVANDRAKELLEKV